MSNWQSPAVPIRRALVAALCAGALIIPPVLAEFAPVRAELAIAEPAAKRVPTKRASKRKAKPGTSKARPTEPKKPVKLERPQFDVQQSANAVVLGMPLARAWGDSEADFVRILPTVTGPWLAMSGGGADGAYSAGLLAGLTKSGKRPEFAVVSGVSIGALIAPYAFLGSKYDDALREVFEATTAADIFEDRATPESLFDSWPLRRLIEKRLSTEMIAEIAAEHRRGRRLYVTTTNLDTGRPTVWNMGVIAERGGDEALKLFRSILLASSSIPGFFPPVLIEAESDGRKAQEMHNDGTLTAPFFLAPEAMLRAGAAKLPASEIYVIVNGKLSPDFGPPGRNTLEILGRSIAVALIYGTRIELALVRGAARQLGIDLNAAYVDAGFTHEAKGLFDGEYMRALYKYAAERAATGNGFQTASKSGLTGATPGEVAR